MSDLPLRHVSETASRWFITRAKTTVGWDPVAGAIGYRFQSESNKPKWSHTWDATLAKASFPKGAEPFRVQAIMPGPEGVYPPVVQPPPGNPDQTVPFDPQSPWNTPIPADAKPHPNSDSYMQRVADKGKPLTSDVDQYTYPVWICDDNTPVAPVTMTGWFSSYDNGDNSKKSWGEKAVIPDVPTPDNAEPSVGTDGSVILWNPQTGVVWGFNRWSRTSQGVTARHGHRYHTTVGYHGRFADGGTGARGMGTPPLAGLVRKWEIDQGRIGHALTFAYHSPSPEFWYPASRSDGGEFGGEPGVDIPEGARIQLNPSLTDTDLAGYGLNAPARVIARALQQYGMYVADNSGSSKTYLEDRKSAGWGKDVHRDMVSGLSWHQFRVLEQAP